MMLNQNKILKQLNIGIYEGGAIAIIVVATLLRLLIIGHNWPVTDSDESTMGLMALLSLGSEGMLRQELLAIGGYPDTLFFGTLVLLIASWLALSSNRDTLQRDRRWRCVVFGCWGLAAGLGLWSDLLIAPIVLAAGLLLVLGCWREWRTWAFPCLLLGLVVGAFPLLIYNVTAQPGQDSLSVFLRIHDVDKPMHLPVMNQAKG